MARRYSTSGDQTYAATTSIVGINNIGTTVRPILYELVIGSDTTPADNAFQLAVKRCSTAGTSTGATPSPHDSSSPVSLVNGCSNYTVEPTKGVILLTINMNQQATFRWVVPPEEGFLAPVTAANGFVIECLSASGGTPEFDATLMHQE